MYQNILLTIDPTDESSWTKALPTAVEHCSSSGAKLHLLTVVPDYGMSAVGVHFPANFQDDAIAKTKKKLKVLAAKGVPDGVEVETMVVCGTIYEEILKAAKMIRPDLVVMASHQPKLNLLIRDTPPEKAYVLYMFHTGRSRIWGSRWRRACVA